MKDDIYIVGGGSSLRDFDFTKLKDKTCMTINYSIVNVPNCKYFVTMDYTFIDFISEKTKTVLTREKFVALPCEKYFVVATNNKYIENKNGQYIDNRCGYKYDLSGIDKVIESNKEYGIGHEYQDFVHGCNSGFCGVQLAILLGYKNIHLLGFDLNFEYDTHYHMAYTQNKDKFIKNLELYKKHFYVAIRCLKQNRKGVTLYNYCENGFLTQFLITKSLDEIS